MKIKAAPFVENIAESTAACLFMMVQGNLMAVTLGHWLIASETGVIAGTIAAGAALIMRTGKRWVVAVLLGCVTVVVDFLVHAGQFGPVLLEAVLTGAGAAALSYLVGLAFQSARTRRSSAPPAG